MSELKEKILNGSVNVFLMGLPIALVLIFGEKFSLWINILAVACLLFVTSLLLNIRYHYEAAKRILHALIGASIAVCLKALAYPGHTAVIIIGTILIICTVGIIIQGKILWLKFLSRSRLHFLGKFILTTTFLFIISLVIANFGSQKIWIPIATTSLIILVLFVSEDYLDTSGIHEDNTIFTSIGILLLTGIISTIIQFSSVEIFWGIKIWQAIVALIVVIVIAVSIIIFVKLKKRKAELSKLREEKEAKELKLREEARARKEREKVAEKERQEKKERAELEVKQRLEEIKSNQRALTVRDLSFLYDHGKDPAVKLISQKSIDEEDFCQRIMVSNNKKQIVWDGHVRDALYLLAYVAKKEFDDEKLNNILVLIDIIRVHVSDRKTEESEYEGETPLEGILKDIENSATAKANR